MEKFLEAGRILNAHGIRGEVRAESWCDSPGVLAGLKTVYIGSAREAVKVEKGSVYSGIVRLKLEGVDDRDAALSLKEKIIYADREDIPLGSGGYFIADMLGAEVLCADSGRRYGRITGVVGGAASLLYEVTGERGSALLPAIPQFIVNTEPGRAVYVRVIEGLLDEI